MRILTLNLNHRTRPAPIPSDLAPALSALEPDVAVLTEYVTGPDHQRFKDQMQNRGYEFSAISDLVEYKPKAWQNQIFILSRHPISQIERHSTAPDSQANTNILTVHIRGTILVGFRAPSYQGQAWLDFWNWLSATALGDIAIGDFNVDPHRNKKRDQALNGFLESGNWQLVQPEGEWSYQGPTGRRSCIDHCVVGPNRSVTAASYHHEPFVGHLTDHAALTVDLLDSTSI